MLIAAVLAAVRVRVLVWKSRRFGATLAVFAHLAHIGGEMWLCQEMAMQLLKQSRPMLTHPGV